MSGCGSGASGVRLAGTGICLPQRVVTNDDLAKQVQTNDAWITQRTGIRQRHVVDPGTTAMHLGAEALRGAITRAGIEPGELDLVLCATMTPEMCCPSTAARIAACVGASPAGAVDLSAACAGFVYGMNMAASLIRTGFYRHIAVVGTEVLSSIVDWNDRRTCILFGDGAGAAVFTRSDNPEQGCLHQTMGSDGNKWADLYCPRHACDLPPGGDPEFSGTFNTLQMNGREVYKFAVSTLQRSVEQTVQDMGIAVSDLDLIIPHQSNQRILESVRDRLKLPSDRLYINIDRLGNTSAASVPICLHELVEQGRVKPGNRVLFVGLGGGLTWASSLWRI